MSTTVTQVKRVKTVSFTLQAQPLPALPAPSRDIFFHLRTLYLFMASDLKTLLLPNLVFGVLGSLCVALVPTQEPLSIGTIPLRALRVAIWIVLNLLPFTIANQYKRTAIAEDAVNKPWRPLPSQRLSSAQAWDLMLTAYIVAFAGSVVLGGVRPSIAVVGLAYCYNNLGGSDMSSLVRNLMNVAFYLCAMVGTIEVAAGTGNVAFTQRAWCWFAMIGMIVLTTVHIQDLPDQKGDAMRGRRTIPLDIGDGLARWSVAIPACAWSVAAPIFWQTGVVGFVLPVALAGIVGCRVLGKRSAIEDKVTLRIWNLWMLSLYLLPFGQ